MGIPFSRRGGRPNVSRPAPSSLGAQSLPDGAHQGHQHEHAAQGATTLVVQTPQDKPHYCVRRLGVGTCVWGAGPAVGSGPCRLLGQGALARDPRRVAGPSRSGAAIGDSARCRAATTGCRPGSTMLLPPLAWPDRSGIRAPYSRPGSACSESRKVRASTQPTVTWHVSGIQIAGGSTVPGRSDPTAAPQSDIPTPRRCPVTYSPRSDFRTRLSRHSLVSSLLGNEGQSHFLNPDPTRGSPRDRFWFWDLEGAAT